MGGRPEPLPQPPNLLKGLPQRGPILRERTETTLEQSNELLTVMRGHGGDIEGHSVKFECGFVIIVVEPRFVEGDQFEHEHTDGKHISLEEVILGLEVEVVQPLQLLWGEDVVGGEAALAEDLVVAGVAVLLVCVEQEELDVALRAEEDRLRAILPQREAILLQEDGHVEQTGHGVDEFILREAGVLQLLLLDGRLKREVVVVGEGVDQFVLDAELALWVRGKLPSISSEWWILARFLCSIFLSWLTTRTYLASRSPSSTKVFLKSMTYS